MNKYSQNWPVFKQYKNILETLYLYKSGDIYFSNSDDMNIAGFYNTLECSGIINVDDELGGEFGRLVTNIYESNKVVFIHESSAITEYLKSHRIMKTITVYRNLNFPLKGTNKC